jgi:hypothetical protein
MIGWGDQHVHSTLLDKYFFVPVPARELIHSQKPLSVVLKAKKIFNMHGQCS